MTIVATVEASVEHVSGRAVYYQSAEVSTVVQGRVVYLSNYKASLANYDTAAASQAKGVTINRADTDDILIIALNGSVIDLGVALTDGTPYYLITSGQIGEYSDVATGKQVVLVGHGKDDNLLVGISVVGDVKQ